MKLLTYSQTSTVQISYHILTYMWLLIQAGKTVHIRKSGPWWCHMSAKALVNNYSSNGWLTDSRRHCPKQCLLILHGVITLRKMFRKISEINFDITNLFLQPRLPEQWVNKRVWPWGYGSTPSELTSTSYIRKFYIQVIWCKISMCWYVFDRMATRREFYNVITGCNLNEDKQIKKTL